MAIFDKRIAFKPFEYPEVTKFKTAINHSYWLVSEWNFTSDINDFHTKLTPVEKNVIKNALLAISQIEVSVKKFWANLGDVFPKAEFDQVGISYGESEVRHADAYSHLLQILGLNDDFATLVDNPVIKGRVDYLTKYLKRNSESKQEYISTLTLFSLYVENVSLFSQFAIIKSFNKHRNILKDIDNVVQATQQEEQIHAQFGAYLIHLIKQEYPDWFNDEFHTKIKKACKKAYAAECGVINWIFEQGELDFISKDSVIEFLKKRFNDSLEMIGTEPIFDIDQEKLKDLAWFDEEIMADVNTDFFYKKPTTYSKRTTSIKSEDLF